MHNARIAVWYGDGAPSGEGSAVPSAITARGLDELPLAIISASGLNTDAVHDADRLRGTSFALVRVATGCAVIGNNIHELAVSASWNHAALSIEAGIQRRARLVGRAIGGDTPQVTTVRRGHRAPRAKPADLLHTDTSTRDLGERRAGRMALVVADAKVARHVDHAAALARSHNALVEECNHEREGEAVGLAIPIDEAKAAGRPVDHASSACRQDAHALQQHRVQRLQFVKHLAAHGALSVTARGWDADDPAAATDPLKALISECEGLPDVVTGVVGAVTLQAKSTRHGGHFAVGASGLVAHVVGVEARGQLLPRAHGLTLEHTPHVVATSIATRGGLLHNFAELA
mmetsp:Transcript_23556/g.26152  ORF Transcript_23556/g.26152 Transcript_23556/m.26152 type:complete len:346 (-) Transcript_23556:2142-3179(-)